MNTFTWFFLAFLTLSIALRLWLAGRQIRHVRNHRERVPDAFNDRIDAAEHRKAADYTVAKTRLAHWELLLGTLLLLGWTLGGGIDAVDRLWQGAGWNPVWTGTAVIVSVILINGVLELPLSLYSTFGIEQRFGFNRSTVGLFIADLVKGLAVGLALGVPLCALALWFMHATGNWWWLWVWGLWMTVSLLLTWAYPAFIAPLFNKFSPLDDEVLKARIEALLDRCGFRSKGIFVMDGSRRSAHGNAYFTGIGSSKRIVFFDTLMDTLDAAQIEAVLAHELGHFKLKHISKRLLLTAALSLAALGLLGWLSTQGWFYAGLGVSRDTPHAALLLFMLAAPAFTFFLTPLAAAYSRKHEFEADGYAARQSDAAALVQALVNLYRENASTLTPDPLHSAFYDSHPPAVQRIRRLQEA